MDEKSLLRIALVVSTAGIIFLAVLSFLIEANDASVEKIAASSGKVAFYGKIKELRSSGEATVFVIEKTSDVSAVAFSNITGFKKGDMVNVLGRQQDSKEEEVIIERLEKIG